MNNAPTPGTPAESEVPASQDPDQSSDKPAVAADSSGDPETEPAQEPEGS